MLDRESSPSTGVAQDGPTGKEEALLDEFVDEQVETRVHRTTIVPLPLDDLDSDPTGLTRPLRLDDDSQFELDEPDLADSEVDATLRLARRDTIRAASELDAPTHLGQNDTIRADKPLSISAVAASVHLSDTAERLILPPKVPSKSTRPPAPALPQPKTDSQQEHPKSDKWYLRVQLDADCVADLWIRDRTPHNVLVWSNDMESWVPLLTVRELRDAIRDAHDAKTREELGESNFVFVNTQSEPTAHQPLPEPRLPGAPLAPRPARPTSLWLQPKPRTISNVPPPLLTTAVPVLASVQPQPAQSQFAKPSPSTMSTVPPVVTSIQPSLEAQLGLAAIPDFPRPARVPDVKSITRVASTPSTIATKQAARVPTDARPSQTTRIGKAQALLAGLPLIHVERALWLAAGVALSSAVMLLMRDTDHDRRSDGRSDVGHWDAPTRVGQTTPTQPVTPPEGHTVPRFEDLPIVSGRASSSEHTAGSSKERTKTSKHAVAAASVKLASASNTLGPSKPTPSAGGFDTAAARRVLTGSASRVSRCATDGPASGSVLVTFAPSGFVQSASISGLSGHGVNVNCVLRAFQEARVPPFSGDAFTVRKGFQIL